MALGWLKQNEIFIEIEPSYRLALELPNSWGRLGTRARLSQGIIPFLSPKPIQEVLMNTVPKLVLTSLMTMLLSGAQTLQAQGLGIKLTASAPKGDLGDSTFLDNKVGYGVGVHLAIPFPGGTLVPRVDYTEYKNADTTNVKAKMLQAGLDYDFYFYQAEYTGPYLGVGLGYGSTKFELDTPHFNDTPNNIFYGAQAGFMFTRHLGAEIRYTYAEYKPHFSGPPTTYNSPTWNASLILQF
jgi:hypothetical protein